MFICIYVHMSISIAYVFFMMPYEIGTNIFIYINIYVYMCFNSLCFLYDALRNRLWICTYLYIRIYSYVY
jgi:hypothetical protein